MWRDRAGTTAGRSPGRLRRAAGAALGVVLTLAGRAIDMAGRAATTSRAALVRVRTIDRRRIAAAVLAAYDVARRRPGALLAAALILGVFVMVLHWQGTAPEAFPRPREAAPRQATARP